MKNGQTIYKAAFRLLPVNFRIKTTYEFHFVLKQLYYSDLKHPIFAYLDVMCIMRGLTKRILTYVTTAHWRTSIQMVLIIVVWNRPVLILDLKYLSKIFECEWVLRVFLRFYQTALEFLQLDEFDFFSITRLCHR